MATQEETTFQEAFAAIQKGEKNRARDLLTRLIKINPAQAQYWLWMSAVVDTTKERVFCLKETLKRDPQNRTARHGLILHGELPPDASLAIAGQLQQRNWEAGFFDDISQLSKPRPLLGIPVWAIVAAAVVLVVVVAIVTANANHVEIPGFVAWIQRYTPAPTAPADAPAFLATATPAPLAIRTQTLPALGLLTATPTALYVNTPHPRTESYRSAIAAYQRNDFSGTVNYLLQVLKEDPKADIYYLLGEAYTQQTKLKDAAQSYDLAIQQDPRFAPAYLGRAHLRQATAPDQTAAVRADLEKAISLDANFAEAYLELAKVKIAAKDAAAALGDLNTAQQLDPDSPLPHFVRAQAYLALSQPDKAVTEARQANQIDPSMLPAYRLLAEAERANGNLNGAIKPLETYTQYTKDPDALAWLGQAYAAAGDPTTGQRLLDQAISLNSQSFEARLARGFFWIEAGNAAKALEDLRQAYALQSGSFQVSLGLGRAALLNKDGSEAWRSLSGALTQAKSDVEKGQAYFWRAQALELSKQYGPAIADWNELLRLNPVGILATLRPTAQARLQQVLMTATPATGTPSVSTTATAQLSATPTPGANTPTVPSATVRPFIFPSSIPTTPPG